MRQQATVGDHRQQVLRQWLGFKGLAGGQVLDRASQGIDADFVAGVDASGLGADQGRQAVVQRVAVEDAGEGLRQHGADAQHLQILRRLFPGRADTEVIAGDEDVAFAESRIRRETIAAEDILHDLGAFSIISSDSQAMGRVGEVITRTWQTADKMKKQRGALPEDAGKGNDNFRAKRYVAKYTINPAIAQGIASHVGSIEVGKIADLVVWKPMFFGTKPDMVVKAGMIIAAAMGDPNASIPTPQPVHYRPMFGAYGNAIAKSSFSFVSQAGIDAGIAAEFGLSKELLAVSNTRNIGKKDMKLNDALPVMEVDPETYQVTADGELLTCQPVDVVPMAQRYFLF